MEQERAMMLEKRRQEREYLMKMLDENERQKLIAGDVAKKERDNDIRAQQEYTRMLDKQEDDRRNEMANREKRAQDFMNKMADTVIKSMDEKQKMEDEMIRKYEMEKELRERMEDERRIREDKKHKNQMANFLNK